MYVITYTWNLKIKTQVYSKKELDSNRENTLVITSEEVRIRGKMEVGD